MVKKQISNVLIIVKDWDFYNQQYQPHATFTSTVDTAVIITIDIATNTDTTTIITLIITVATKSTTTTRVIFNVLSTVVFCLKLKMHQIL